VLQPYKFTVEHIAGNKLTAADGLSRRPYDEPANLEDDEELQEDSFIAHIEPDIFDSVSNYDLKHGHRNNQWHVLTIDSTDNSVESPDSLQISPSVEADDVSNSQLLDLWSSQGKDIAKLQHDSKDLQPILSWLEDGILPTTDQDARRLILQAEHYQIIDGVLYHLHYPRTKRMNKLKPVIQQLCVHDVLWEDVMVAYHDNNGHIGRERLYETLKQKYHYPQMYTSVLEYVSTCKECQ